MNLILQERGSSETQGLSWNENITTFGPGYVCSRVGDRYNCSIGDE